MWAKLLLVALLTCHMPYACFSIAGAEICSGLRKHFFSKLGEGQTSKAFLLSQGARLGSRLTRPMYNVQFIIFCYINLIKPISSVHR